MLDNFTPQDLLPTITAASITEEIQSMVQALVNNSLAQYSAYSLKEAEARAYLDSKITSPSLEAEAKIRGLDVKALCSMIIEKADKMKAFVSGVEVIRLTVAKEFDSAPDKLAFRDSILKEARSIM